MNDSASASRSTINQTLGALAAMMILGGFYTSFSLVIPKFIQTRDELATIQAELEQSKAAATKLTATKDQVVTATRQLASAGIDLDVVDQMLPATEDIPGLYQLLDRVLIENPGLEKPIYQIGQPTKASDGKVQVRISASATCTYDQCKAFIRSLQGMLRPVSINSVGLSAIATQAGSYTLTVEGFVSARGLSSSIEN